MQQKKTGTKGDISPEKKGGFLSLSEQERDTLLERNREARKKEREDFIEAYFSSDVSYNIK